jgi:cell division protein FtsN
MAAVAQLRSSTVIAAGQIATTIIGFALGVVMTLIFVFDRSEAPVPQVATPAPHRQVTDPIADTRPLALPVPVPETAPAAPDVAPMDDASADTAPAAPVARPRNIAPAGRMVFAVQAGAFLNRATAEHLVDRLSAAGAAATLSVHSDGAGRRWNFVRLTQTFRARDAALSAVRALSHSAGITALIVRVPATDEVSP